MVGAQRRIESGIFPGTVQLLDGALQTDIIGFNTAHEIEPVGFILGITMSVIPLVAPFGGVKRTKVIVEHRRGAIQADTVGLAGFLNIFFSR